MVWLPMEAPTAFKVISGGWLAILVALAIIQQLIINEKGLFLSNSLFYHKCLAQSSGVRVNSFLAILGYLAIKRSSSSTRGFCASTLAYLTSSRISSASSLFLNVTSILPII